MATLYLDHINRSIPPLREWLDGKWGLLLSHPNDFENYSLESDRWLEIVRDRFQAHGVKPMALRCLGGGEPDRGWVSTVTQDEQRVRLAHHEWADIAARRLRDRVVSTRTARLVVMVDPSLCHHVILKYGCGARGVALSPLDLLGRINAMRRPSETHANDYWPRRAA